MLLITLFACLCWAHGEQALGHVVSLNWVCSDHWHKLWRKLGSWKNWTVRWKVTWPRKRKRQVRRSKKPSLLTLVLSAFKVILVCGDISVILVIKVARINIYLSDLKMLSCKYLIICHFHSTIVQPDTNTCSSGLAFSSHSLRRDLSVSSWLTALNPNLLIA